MDPLITQWHRTIADASGTPRGGAPGSVVLPTRTGIDGSGSDSSIECAGQALLARWGEAHRRYHTQDHLAAFLAALDQLTDGQAPAPVRLAGWFHDAIYQARPGDDEEHSAQLAEQVLPGVGVPPEVVWEVARLVRLTAGHHVGNDDTNGALMTDADLSVLAGSPGEYAEYAGAVRQEYAHVPDAAFRQGRLAVLTDLLGRDPLFHTERARELWQQRARANLVAECGRLSAPTPL